MKSILRFPRRLPKRTEPREHPAVASITPFPTPKRPVPTHGFSFEVLEPGWLDVSFYQPGDAALALASKPDGSIAVEMHDDSLVVVSVLEPANLPELRLTGCDR